MYLVRDADNALTDSVSEYSYELHIQANELVEIIGPQGDPMYLSVADNGKLRVQDAFYTQEIINP